MVTETKKRPKVVAGAGSSGGGGGSESADTLKSNSYLSIIDLLGEGQIGGLVDNSPRSIFLDGTPIVAKSGDKNFDKVTWRTLDGRQDQGSLGEGFDTIENAVTLNREVTNEAPVAFSINDSNIEAVRLVMAVPTLTHSDKKGNIRGSSVDFRVEVSINSGAYRTVGDGRISGKTRSRYQRSYLYKLPRTDLAGNPSKSWTFRVVRVTPESTNSSTSNALYVDSYTSIIETVLTYPNSAIVGLELNAEEFTGEPQRSYLVDGLLIRVPKNRNGSSRTYDGTWTGEYKLESCDNPAWILFDLLSNERYGLGQFVPYEYRNPARLYQIGRYCDEMVDDGFGNKEPRFTINTAITSLADAYQLISDICSVFNGMAYWTGNMIGFMADMPSAPTMIYSQANVINGDFTYQSSSRKDRHSVALVSYNDPEYNYETRTEYVEDSELIERFGIRKNEIAAFGCTTRGQAHRVGKWLLYTEKYQSSTVNFRVGVDSLFVAPGDIVQISDVYRAGKRQGGRLISATLNDATLDAELTIPAGSVIAIRVADGSLQERKVAGVTGSKVYFDKPLTQMPEPLAVFQVTSPNLQPVTARVISVAQSDNAGEYEISAVMHNETKFDYIEKDYKLETVNVTSIDPTASVSQPKSVTITPERQIEQGVTKYNMSISWEQVRGASAYLVKYRKEDGNWVSLPVQTDLTVDVDNVYAGYYEASVQALSPLGGKSQVTYSEITAVDGSASFLPKPLNVQGESLAWGIGLSWSFPSEASGVQYTEIEQCFDYDNFNPSSATWKTLTAVPYPASTYELSGLTTLDHRWFRFRLVDSLGQKGEWSEVAYSYPTSDIDAIKEILEGQVGSELLDSALLGEISQAQKDALQAINDAKGLAAKLIAESEARQAQIKNEVDGLLSVIGDEATDRTTAIENAIASESLARQEAIKVETQARVQAAEKEALDRNTAITAAINKEVTNRNNAIKAETTARTNALAEEARQRELDIQGLASQVETDVATLNKSISDQAKAQTTALTNKATQLTNDYTKKIGDLQTKTNTDVKALNDGLTSAVDEFRTADGAITTSLNAHKVSTANSLSAVQESVKTAVDANGATNERLNAHIATFETFETKSKADVTALTKTVADNKTATTTQINNLSTQFDSKLATTNSSVKDVADSVSALDKSTATKFSSVEASIGNLQSGADDTNTAVANALSVANSAVTTNNAQATQLNQLTASLKTTDANVAKKADITVTDGIKADVTKNAQGIASAVADITKLNNSLTTTNTNLAKKADTTALNTLKTQVNELDGELTAQSTQMTELEAQINTVDAKAGTAITNAAKAQQTADTAVSNGNAISQRIDELQASLFELGEGTETLVDVTAFNALKAQVNTNKDSITATNSNVTKLQSDLNTQTTGLNGVKETVAGHTTAIGGLTTTQTQQGKDIKQATSDITLLKTEMDAVEADVKTRATTTALNSTNTAVTKVDGRVTTVTSDLTKLAGRVTTTENNIAKKADATALNDYYTKTDADKAIAGQITTFDANLVIGGVNLLTGTTDVSKSVTFSSWQHYLPDIPLSSLSVNIAGVEVTWSAFIEAGANEQVSLMLHCTVPTSVASTGYKQYQSNFIPAGKSGWVHGTAVVPPETTSIKFAIRHPKSESPSNTSKYHSLQLEVGNKATAWAPSPRDVQNALDANAQAIRDTNVEVGKVDGRVTTTASDLTKLTGRVTTAENGLKLKADTSALNNYYTKTQADDKATTLAAGQITSFSAKLTNVAGKNLFDFDAWNKATKALSSSVPSAPVQLLPKTKYTISTNIVKNTNGFDVFAVLPGAVASSTLNGTAVNAPHTFTTDETGIVNIAMRSNTLDASFNKWIQIELGDKATAFVPHVNNVKAAMDLSDTANANAINTTKAEVTRIDGVVKSEASKVSKLQSDLTAVDTKAGTAITNAATAQQTANTATTKANSVATQVDTLSATFNASKGGQSLIPDYFMEDFNSWRSHYNYDLKAYFTTVTDGKISSTVFRKPATIRSCWNYSRTALPNDRAYKLSMWVRRAEGSTGTNYFVVNLIGADGKHDNEYGHKTVSVTANNQWQFVSVIMDYTAQSATVAQLAFGFAVNHSGTTDHIAEVQGFKVSSVLGEDDIDDSIATESRVVGVLETMATADTALGKRIDTLSSTVNTNNTNLTSKITTTEQTLVKADQALGVRIDSVTTTFNNKDTATNARIDTVSKTVTDNNTAIANRATTLETSMKEVSKVVSYIIGTHGGSAAQTNKTGYTYVGRVVKASGTLVQAFSRGLNVMTISTTSQLSDYQKFDIYGADATAGNNAAKSAADYLNGLAAGTRVLIVGHDNIRTLGTDTNASMVALRTALLGFGFSESYLKQLTQQQLPIMVGQKGGNASSVLEVMKVGTSGSDWIQYPLQLLNGVPVNSAEALVLRKESEANAKAHQDLVTEVSRVDGDVKVNAKSIQTLQSDLTTVDTKAGTAITNAANAQTTANTAVTKAESAASANSTLEAKFNRSAIAGANLLVNSNKETLYSADGAYPHGYYELGEPWEVNAKYTLVWCATHTRASGDTTSSLAMYAGGGNQSVSSFASATKKITKVTFTKNSTGTAQRMNFYLLSKPANGVATVATVHWAVLVKGDLITTQDSWIPSTYDYLPELAATNATIKSNQTALTNADTALGKRIDTVNTSMATEKTRVDGLINTVTKSVSDLTSSTNTKFDEIKGSFDTVNNSLASKANTSALSGYYTKAQADSAISTSVNNMKASLVVGGTNLLLNSNFREDLKASWATNGGGITRVTDTTYGKVIQTNLPSGITHPWVKLENGVEYTYSAWVKPSTALAMTTSTPLHYHAGLNSVNQSKISVVDRSHTGNLTANKWQKVWIVFKLTGDANTFKPFIYGASGTLQVAWTQLELGNKATDWSPNPQDVVGEIASINESVAEYNRTVDTWVERNKAEAAMMETIAAELVPHMAGNTELFVDVKYDASYKGVITALAHEDAVLAQRIDTIQAQFNQNKALVEDYTEAFANVEQSVASRLTKFEAEFEPELDMNAIKTEIAKIHPTKTQISNEYITKAAANTAIASATTTLKSEVTTAYGTAITNAMAGVKLDSITIPDTRADNQTPNWYWTNYGGRMVNEFKTATAIGLTTALMGQTYCMLSTYVYYKDSTGGAIKQVATGNSEDKVQVRYSSGSGASATWGAWKQQGSTEVAKLSTTITQNAQTVDGIKGVKTVTIDNNGVLSGYGLVSELVSGKVTSAFGVNADQFYVGSPSTGKKVFSVVNGTTVINDAVIGNLSATKITSGTMHGDRITAGTIKADRLSAAAIDAIAVKANNITVTGADGSKTVQTGGLTEIYYPNGKVAIRLGIW